MRILVITEMSGTADEGMKNWGRTLVAALDGAGADVRQLELAGDPRTAAFAPGALRAVGRARPDVIQYVPYSGLTRTALSRLRALALTAPGATTAIGILQADGSAQTYPRFLRADVGLFASRRVAGLHRSAVCSEVVVPPVVDTRRFASGDSDADRLAVRQLLAVPENKRLVLHVGHLRQSRNLALLAGLQDDATQVLVIASTSTQPEPAVLDQLRSANIRVIREYRPDIARFYRAADLYVFPVVDPRGSIEVPLSVLEALACGTPVVSTAFGGLEEFLPASADISYALPDDFAQVAQTTLADPRRGDGTSVRTMSESALAASVLAAYAGVGRPRTRTGRLVVIAGVDGAGKTTQVAAVRDALQRDGVRVETIWGRWDPFLAKPAITLLDRLSARTAERPGAKSAHAARRGIRRRLLAFGPLRAAWLGLMVIDYAVRLAPRVRRAGRRTDLLLLDRYWLDVMIDFSVGGELARPPRALEWLLPSPSRVFVLDLPEALASARSEGVHDSAYLAQRRELYHQVVKRGQAVAIDASRAPHEVTADLLNRIEPLARKPRVEIG